MLTNKKKTTGGARTKEICPLISRRWSLAHTDAPPPCGIGYLAGRVCRGDFSPAAAVLSLSFRDDQGVVSNAVYRAVDANS